MRREWGTGADLPDSHPPSLPRSTFMLGWWKVEETDRAVCFWAGWKNRAKNMKYWYLEKEGKKKKEGKKEKLNWLECICCARTAPTSTLSIQTAQVNLHTLWQTLSPQGGLWKDWKKDLYIRIRAWIFDYFSTVHLCFFGGLSAQMVPQLPYVRIPFLCPFGGGAGD